MTAQNVESDKILIVTGPQLLEDYARAFQGDNDRKFPFYVQAINNQAVAKELFLKIKFDLVILEHKGNTEEDGLQLLAWMKEKQPKTEVLATSATVLATSATVVDVLNGHVHEIEGDVVYAKYLINGEEHQAAFDIALFQEAGADFQGAQVRFLTLKTEVLATSATDESKPYDLKIELKEKQTSQIITRDVQEKLDRLEQFDKLS